MFVFPYSFPFESLAPVVVGRWHVDYGILHFSHKQKHNIVDLTLLMSAHQGSESARRYKFEVAEDDFF